MLDLGLRIKYQPGRNDLGTMPEDLRSWAMDQLSMILDFENLGKMIFNWGFEGCVLQIVDLGFRIEVWWLELK